MKNKIKELSQEDQKKNGNQAKEQRNEEKYKIKWLFFNGVELNPMPMVSQCFSMLFVYVDQHYTPMASVQKVIPNSEK